MTVSMEQFIQLVNRVEKLEQKQKKIADNELDWALNQFRYKDKTSDESKALGIIEKRLGTKKTIRAKSVPCQH
jgi:hypothetical protein